MSERLAELRRRVGEISDLDGASALLSWDQETKMPPGGAEARATQRASVERAAHERLTSEELARLLEELREEESGLDDDSEAAALIRVTRRDHEKSRRIPADLRAEMTREGVLGMTAWVEARARSDYSILLPHLERQLELKLRYVEALAPYDDPYDSLLDDFEEGMTTAEVAAVFERLKRELVPIVAAVQDAPPVDDSCLRGTFAPDLQRQFSLIVLENWGFDRASWRLDPTIHPFATAPAISDIRITTRFEQEHFGGVFACMHEFGHGLYERQIAPSLARTALCHGVSSAFHESQSRLWENLVGRGRPCWRFFYPHLQQVFPDQFGDVDVETFYRAVNKVQPSLIRVEADEVTYNLHVILRFELERDILAGRLELRDLPEAFNAKMATYLGIEPPDDAHGVLQDMHWSDFTFGYFPTYALGNVISVQLWERVLADVPELDERFERGDFGVLREWLAEHVHRHGRMFSPAETLQRAVGASLDPEPYLRYLRRKVEDVAGVAVP